MGGKFGVTCLATAFLIFTGLTGLAPVAQGQPQAVPKNQHYQIFGFNDLGMHCYDKDFSVFSLLPPFNTIHAQVIKKELKKPVILNSTAAKITYRGDYSNRYETDANGNVILIGQNSINTTSANKTNFWTYVGYLFPPAVGLKPDIGLTGSKMPNATFGPQAMIPEASYKWFTAQGIPLTNIDDNGNINCFPFMKLEAFTPAGKSLGTSLDVVLPLSTEFRCAACHESASWIDADKANGIDWVASDAAPPPRVTSLTPDSFSNNLDFEIRFRENILILHDAMSGTNLMAQYNGGKGQPVLCASCHYSKALDLEGKGPQGVQLTTTYLSRAMHKHHGTTYPVDGGMGGMGGGGNFVIPIPGEGTVTQCYFCHPGNDTQCLRSVMATKGMQCQSCHGGLLSLGGYTPDLADPMKVAVTDLQGNFMYYLFDLPADQLAINLKTNPPRQREPWADMPKCQSCHSGDALNHLPNSTNSIVGTVAYADGDPSATPLLAKNQRFAENPGTLYRFSKTHGGVACESCHGSTHAEWPARTAGNDNTTATQIQGYPGEISDCNACHLPNMPANQKGPHGLHNVNDHVWVASHGSFVAANGQSCKACHGKDLKGTVLSRAKADRQFPYQGKNVSFPKDTQVSCYACHKKLNKF